MKGKNVMQNFIYLIILFVVGISAFFIGYKVKGAGISKLPTYKLNTEVIIQQSTNETGSIPSGATIYEYSTKGEIATYVVFFNLKNRMIIEPIKFEQVNTIDPLSGYTE